jgi:hypothetical protein
MSEKKQGPVVTLEGNGLMVNLTMAHLQRFLSGSVSIPHYRELEHVALTFAFFKFTGRTEADSYVRNIYVYDGTSGAIDGIGTYHCELLHGPTDKLLQSCVRTLVLRQTLTDGASGKSCPFFITAVYDRQNVCFVDNEGNCLYVKREDIINSISLPLLHNPRQVDDEENRPAGSTKAERPQHHEDSNDETSHFPFPSFPRRCHQPTTFPANMAM